MVDDTPAGPGHPRVRDARREDRGALLALQRSLPRPNPDLLRGALDGVGRGLVSTVDGGIPVGYLLALGRAAAPDDPADRRSETDTAGGRGDDDATTGAYVAELAVAPARRREGRATELLDALRSRLDGGWITLTVAPDNEPARRCYEAAGFRELRRDPDFFDGQPAVVMGRRAGGDTGEC
jgi:ribosomal-protein-alanine N-acetyltransferase